RSRGRAPCRSRTRGLPCLRSSLSRAGRAPGRATRPSSSRFGLHSKSLGARPFPRLVSSAPMDRRTQTNAPPKGKKLPPSLWAAKFPPDDDALPAGPPAPAGGGFADDGNFKRGRFSPVAILVALLLVVGGGTALYLGMKSEGEKMTVDAI